MNTLLLDPPRHPSPIQLWMREHGIQITRGPDDLFIWRSVGVHIRGHVISGAANDEEALLEYAHLEDLPTWHQQSWCCGENDFTAHELRHMRPLGGGTL